MSSRSKMMGAGNASSTLYNSNVNINTFGGNKKQGITSRVGLDNWSNLAVQTYSNGYGRNKLFCMNQLGGIGAGKSMFNGRFNRVDGIHCQAKSAPVIPVTNPDTLRITNVQNDPGPPLPPGYTFFRYGQFPGFGTVISFTIETVPCDINEIQHINVDGIIVDVIDTIIDEGRGTVGFVINGLTLNSTNIGILTCVTS